MVVTRTNEVQNWLNSSFIVVLSSVSSKVSLDSLDFLGFGADFSALLQPFSPPSSTCMLSSPINRAINLSNALRICSSPIAIYQGWLMVGYATAYTMLPVFSLVLDRDVNEDVALLYPELYKELTKVQLFHSVSDGA